MSKAEELIDQVRSERHRFYQEKHRKPDGIKIPKQDVKQLVPLFECVVPLQWHGKPSLKVIRDAIKSKTLFLYGMMVYEDAFVKSPKAFRFEL